MASEARILKKIKDLTKIGENRSCCDCPEKMPSNLNLQFGVLVCMTCAAIHRKLQYRIKGISVSTFTESELKLLESEGNALFNAKYMARYNPRDFPLPDHRNAEQMERFITSKYKDKRWFTDATPAVSVSSVASSSAPTTAAVGQGFLLPPPSSSSSSSSYSSSSSSSVPVTISIPTKPTAPINDLLSMSPVSSTSSSAVLQPFNSLQPTSSTPIAVQQAQSLPVQPAVAMKTNHSVAHDPFELFNMPSSSTSSSTSLNVQPHQQLGFQTSFSGNSQQMTTDIFNTQSTQANATQQPQQQFQQQQQHRMMTTAPTTMQSFGYNNNIGSQQDMFNMPVVSSQQRNLPTMNMNQGQSFGFGVSNGNSSLPPVQQQKSQNPFDLF